MNALARKKMERFVRKIISDAKKTGKHIKKMREVGTSDREIAKALELSEEDLRIL